MTNEFDTRELQEHVRQQALKVKRERATTMAIVFFLGVMVGIVPALIEFSVCRNWAEKKPSPIVTVTRERVGVVTDCLFDNDAVPGDFVTLSEVHAGMCHDAGLTPNGEVVGRVAITPQ